MMRSGTSARASRSSASREALVRSRTFSSRWRRLRSPKARASEPSGSAVLPRAYASGSRLCPPRRCIARSASDWSLCGEVAERKRSGSPEPGCHARMRSLTPLMKWGWATEKRALDAADVRVRRDLVPLLFVQGHRCLKKYLPVRWRRRRVMEVLALAEDLGTVALILLGRRDVLVPDQVRVFV